MPTPKSLYVLLWNSTIINIFQTRTAAREEYRRACRRLRTLDDASLSSLRVVKYTPDAALRSRIC